MLIDGRRMPSVPVSGTGFRQADVNAIPLHAIERIEILTGAAGGIHGFGALGGVVNVVLDRESRGFDLHVTQGISSRGDAHRQGVEASYGRTSASGATEIALFASRSQSEPLLVGERAYAVRDRRRTFELIPELYRILFPHGNSVSVSGVGSNLVLRPEFGGAMLPSDRTFLPAGFSGDPTALGALLTQHAGQLDFSLPDGVADSDLTNDTRSDALLMNVRHRFGARLEGYLDGLVLRSRGQARDQESDGIALIFAESPANPFTDLISVTFPIPEMGLRFSKRVESTRYTAGLATDLPLGWRGTVEVSSGAFRIAQSGSSAVSAAGLLLLLGEPSDLDTNPLGNWDAFQDAVSAEAMRASSTFTLRNRFRNHSLRLAGPVLRTAAGPATLTLLGEHQTEEVPDSTDLRTFEQDGITTTTSDAVHSRSSATDSLYAEVRAPLSARGLELQLAVRHDEQKDEFARHPFGEDDGGRVHADFAGTAYTAGLKFSPFAWLMLRGSYATGEQPPPLPLLREEDEATLTGPIGVDPRRGGTPLGLEGEYLNKSGGNPTLDTVRASTVFLGAVVTPFGEDGPRFAVDYSRIRRTRDVLEPSADLILAHEELWPERVTRAPLTDADRASGHTAGRVTMIDTRAFNGASLEVDALDARVEWPMPFLNGRLRLYADATYHMRNVQQSPFEPDVRRAGYWDGPLKWRANGGVDWSTDQLTIGANLQHFGSYLVLHQGLFEPLNELAVLQQGSPKIPSQTYLDLNATWRMPIRNFGPLEDLTLDFGVLNVLDAAPPRESSLITLTGPGPGYSRYGDPRQRRFELVLSSHF